LAGWNCLEPDNLIHVIEGFHDDVEVLDEETDVFGLPLVKSCILHCHSLHFAYLTRVRSDFGGLAPTCHHPSFD
jgi:hypothetical protein